MTKKLYCCFCGTEIEDGCGNNPSPASTYEDDRCCPVCDSTIVWKARVFIDRLITETQKHLDDKQIKNLETIDNMKNNEAELQRREIELSEALENKGLALVNRQVETGTKVGIWDVYEKKYAVVDSKGNYATTDFNLSLDEVEEWAEKEADTH